MTKLANNDCVTEDNFLSHFGEDIAEAPLSKDKMMSMKERILNRTVACAPTGGTTVRAQDRKWYNIAPGISINTISQDLKAKTQTSIWRVQAGAVIPEHDHNNQEECIVLKGMIRIGDHILNEGDLHIMEAGSHHEPLHAVTDALLYLKHDLYEDIGWLAG